ncbi:MAG: pyruvate kinase, partial [Anaerolineales bacterium]
MTHNSPEKEDRRAKILATLGPACKDEQALTRLIEAGINGVRLNFSHGTQSDHKKMIEVTRKVSKELDEPIAIVQDLQGPKLRTGDNKGDQPIELNPGDEIVLSTEAGLSTPAIIHVNYEPLARDVSRDDRILIDDGRIELRVIESNDKRVRT